jgi:hypothetical protein
VFVGPVILKTIPSDFVAALSTRPHLINPAIRYFLLPPIATSRPLGVPEGDEVIVVATRLERLAVLTLSVDHPNVMVFPEILEMLKTCPAVPAELGKLMVCSVDTPAGFESLDDFPVVGSFT